LLHQHHLHIGDISYRLHQLDPKDLQCFQRNSFDFRAKVLRYATNKLGLKLNYLLSNRLTSFCLVSWHQLVASSFDWRMRNNTNRQRLSMQHPDPKQL